MLKDWFLNLYLFCLFLIPGQETSHGEDEKGSNKRQSKRTQDVGPRIGLI